MKKTTIVGFAMAALLASCTQPEAPVSQAGAYSLDKVIWNDGTKDNESSAADGNTQFKIYTADSYFYIAQGKDSSVAFGVGSYTQKDANNIEELNLFSTTTLDTVGTAKLAITRNEKGYKQVISEIMLRGAKWSGTEEYTKLEGSGTSDLDGVWHQTKSINVTGQDSVVNTYNEYKVYHAGHFMWAARAVADTTSNTFANTVGKGSFTLSNGALTEDLTFCSNKIWVGKYNIPVTFNGPDEFTQTISDTVNKVTSIKTYKRVSK
jgi:hypothetical protein